MPRPKTVDVEAIKEHFHKYRDSFLLGLPKRQSNVWEQLANDLENRYSTIHLRIIFWNNRHNILNVLGLQNILQERDAGSSETTNECSADWNEEDSSCNSSAEGVESSVQFRKEFQITLSAEEWSRISPRKTVYKCKDKSNPVRLTRMYEVLPADSGWTALINSHIFDNLKTACCLSFKRSKVCRNGEKFLKISAFYTECMSSFEGIMEKEPNSACRAVIQCTYEGNFDACSSKKKRRILATDKEGYLKEYLTRNESASFFRGKLINGAMNLGDNEPSHIPKLNSLRVLKTRFKKKEKLHEDPAQSVLIMKYCDPFAQAIRYICLDPFIVFYWSPSQVSVYNNYCKSTQVPSVSIDGTGGVVSQVPRPFGRKSKSIFLYNLSVYDKAKRKQISVANMLSESHTAVTISHFLNNFFNLRTPVKVHAPKEAVSDHSVALLSAMVQSLTQFPSLKSNLHNCAQILPSDTAAKFEIPDCYIRCDVAHVVKIIASLKPLQSLSEPRIREFYIRSICQIVQSTSVTDVKNLLFSIFVLSSSRECGFDGKGEALACEREKTELKRRIARGASESGGDERVGESLIQEYLQVPPGTCDFNDYRTRTEEGEVENEAEEEEIGGLSFKKWGQQILEEAEEAVKAQSSEDLNVMYLPALAQSILKLLETVALWSAIMVPYFHFGELTASTAPCESLFNDVKTRMLGHLKIPISADMFLMYHIPHNESALKIAEAQETRSESQEFQEGRIAEEEADDPGEVNINVSPMHETENQVSGAEENVHGQMFELSQESNDISMCPACSNGHLPDGAHRCVICDKAVHIIFSQCGVPASRKEGYGQGAYCAACNLRKGKERQSTQKEGGVFTQFTTRGESVLVNEATCVENWRGKALPIKKRPRKSYLTPNIELESVDLSCKRKARPIGVLKNGNRVSSLKPVAIDGNKYIITNTCAFDSVAQILACAYFDSDSYRNFVKKQPMDKAVWRMIEHMDTKGITKWCYEWRAKCLAAVYPITPLQHGIYRIEAEIVLDKMTKFILEDNPSITEETQCSAGVCSNSLKFAAISVEASPGQQLDLNKTVSESLQTKHSSCTKESSASHITLCHLSQFHLIFKLFVYKEEADSDVEPAPAIQLSDIPFTVTVAQKTYKLRGAVASLGLENVSGFEHFTSYCHRLQYYWELYNDSLDKKVACAAKKKIPCELLIYTT